MTREKLWDKLNKITGEDLEGFFADSLPNYQKDFIKRMEQTPYEQEMWAHILANQIEEARAAFAAGFELLEETGRLTDQASVGGVKLGIEMLIVHILEQK